MIQDQRGKDLFIVDNSAEGWNGLRYLEEWAQYAKAYDIATGYFEIGALLALDGKWQGLDKMRILMGAETTLGTKKAIQEAVRQRALGALDASIEAVKTENPFLTGVPGILEALRTGQIHCRVYDKDKFHAKAYITHAKSEVIGSQALVGSSNFTKPGLTTNIELNVQIQSAREVAQLQEWFEKHWADATELSDAVIQVIERQVRTYSPFEVYAKALQEWFKGHELTDSEWELQSSRVFKALDRYQKEAYWSLLKMAVNYRGAFLCDGVGLGKTFVGLMLIERLIRRDGKRVMLLAPKAAKEAVWLPHLREWLPDIGSEDFSSLAVFSHTDLSRKGYLERFERMAELADVIVIDEAHHFRNRGSKTAEEGELASRYWRLFDLINHPSRQKQVFLLTATPINNQLTDFRHLVELFTAENDQFFGQTLGINNLKAHFNAMEKAMRRLLPSDSVQETEHLAEAVDILSKDDIFRHLVVQRSRAYAKESQMRETGSSAMFPERSKPIVAEYSIRKTYGKLLDLFDRAFQKKDPLFKLPMYYPLAWYIGKDTSIDPLVEGRQKEVVSLIRTQFLKRFESSVVAFELSCDRLLDKMLGFVVANSHSKGEKDRLERWRSQHAELIGWVEQQLLNFEAEDTREAEDADDEDHVFLGRHTEPLDTADYDVPEMLQETYLDLNQLVEFLAEVKKFKPKDDDKLKSLISLLKSKDVAGQKVLIFTEFADTARYLRRQLENAKISGVAQVDGSSKGNRADVIRRFSPYYNGSSSGQLKDAGLEEITVLISTDVLSEGLNLQDATLLINYDLHWNPVRLMQRIGRVDRRMSPKTEAAITEDHPEQAARRGLVQFWNFLPPDELNAILSLYKRLVQKTLLISKTLGIEGGRLLKPDDIFDDLKVMNGFEAEYQGQKTPIEEMHLELQDLLLSDPTLEQRLKTLPGAVFSGRERVSKGARGVFFCYALPALDVQEGEFTEAAGRTGWYFCDLERDEILTEPAAIVGSIRSAPDTPRECRHDERALVAFRTKVEKHITNTYLKRIQAPVGVKPVLKCWMELN